MKIGDLATEEDIWDGQTRNLVGAGKRGNHQQWHPLASVVDHHVARFETIPQIGAPIHASLFALRYAAATTLPDAARFRSPGSMPCTFRSCIS